MSSPSHGSTSAVGNSAAAASNNENAASVTSRVAKGTQEALHSTNNAPVTSVGNGSSVDESRSLNAGQQHAVSLDSHTGGSSSQTLRKKPPTTTAKVTHQSQDHTVSNGTHSNQQGAASHLEKDQRVERNESISVSSTGHERDSGARERRSILDSRNPDDAGALLNVPTKCENAVSTDVAVSLERQRSMPENSRLHDSVAGPERDVQVAQAISTPPGQVALPNSTICVEQGKVVSQISSVASQGSAQLGDSSLSQPAEIVEGTAVVRVMGIPAGDLQASEMNVSTTGTVPQSQMNLLQTTIAPCGATVVGMVGTTPIVRLPENSTRVVTKKRGRFKVFQPVIDIAAIASTGSSPNTSTDPPPAMDPQGSSVQVAKVPEGSVATDAVGAAQSSNQPLLPPSTQGKHQTFEGTGAPVVKRKGRFFVTNLKDPGLIAININPQVVTGVPVQTLVAPTSAPATQGTVECYQTAQTYMQTMAPTAVVAPGPPDAHRSMAIDSHSFNNCSVAPSTVHMPQQNHSPQQVQYQQPGAYIPAQYHIDYNAQQQAAQTQQPAISQQNAMLPNLHTEGRPTDTSDVKDIPERAANVADRSGDHSEASRNHKLLSRRYQSVPKSSRDDHLTPTGLGKVFHFLDQMRIEVSQADKTIKTLQGDIRLLKEKNKELEAKAIDAEKKLREEKALRESTEAKLKTLRKKLRSMRDEVEVQKEDDLVRANATRPEQVEPGLNPASPATSSGKHLHSTDNQRDKSPELDTKKTAAVELQSVPATPDDKSKPKSPSPAKKVMQNASDKALPPTPPVSRRKGASSPNVQVSKPSPSHIRVNSTSRIPSHTGHLNALMSANSTTSFPNQHQSRNADSSPVLHSMNAPPIMAGSAKREFGAGRLVSTNFDPLAPKVPETLDQDVAAPPENPQNNFDPFSSATPSNQYNGTGLQYGQHSTMNVMQPSPVFLMNQNVPVVPLYGFSGSSFEGLDHMPMANQPMMQVFDQSQIITPTPSMQEMQHANSCRELHQSILLVPQQTFQGYAENDQTIQNKFASDTGNNMNGEQSLHTRTPSQWSQQQQGSTVLPDTQATPNIVSAPSSQSRLSMPPDPFDELLNRPNHL